MDQKILDNHPPIFNDICYALDLFYGMNHYGRVVLFKDLINTLKANNAEVWEGKYTNPEYDYKKYRKKHHTLRNKIRTYSLHTGYAGFIYKPKMKPWEYLELQQSK